MPQPPASAPTPRPVVAALFDTSEQALRAIHALHAVGFPKEDIGVALRHRDDAGQLREETGADTAAIITGEALGGGLTGALIGLIVGTAALAIPGVGPIIAGGVFASILGATAAGAGIGLAGGGIIGALVHLGVPEHQAHHLARGFHAGGVLVTLHPGPRADEARTLLEHAGGDTGAAAGAPGEYTEYGAPPPVIAPGTGEEMPPPPR